MGRTTHNYQKLLQEFRLRLEGDWKPGDKLPTVRDWVDKYGVSASTVNKVLKQLSQEGRISARPGSGTFVTPNNPGTSHDDLSWQEVVLGGLPKPGEGLRELMVPPPLGTLPLGKAYFDPSLQATDLVNSAAKRVARRPAVWGWAAAEGLESLRSWFAQELGVVRSHDVQIVPGGQAGLATVLRALAAPGSPIAVESPTYPGALGIMRAAGLQPVAVPTDAQGVRPDYLATAFERSKARLFYTQPTYSNPTGAVLSEERRKEVLRVAEKAGAFVIENDYARGLHLEGTPPPPLVTLDSGRVVYLRTLSKTTVSGLRIAAIVARGQAGAAIRALRPLEDHFVSGFLQEVALDVLTNPAWKRHLSRVRAELRTRRDAALAELEAQLPEARLHLIPQGGFFLWLRFPDGINDGELASRALLSGVRVFPGRLFFPHEPLGSFTRIGYAAAEPEVLQLGIKKLAQAYRSLP